MSQTNLEEPTKPMTDPRYPVGKFPGKRKLAPEERKHMIHSISEAPKRFREAVKGLNDQQLDTPYREGGWTVRQVIHHLADSHMNAYIRMRFTLTENNPTVKAYDENLWAKLEDARTAPVEPSLNMLDGIHHRWMLLLNSLGDVDFERSMQHSENGSMTLDDHLIDYEWHGRHHAAHITSLRAAKNW